MRLPPFRLHKPSSLDEALELLDDDDAEVYMGGTELLMLMKLGLAAPDHLVDCKGLDELRGISLEGDSWSIGAGVTHRELERSADVRRCLPALADLERVLANVRVRNAGTLGGNLCFAEPHSDPATVLVALGASVTLVSSRGDRAVPIESFFHGPLMTALDAGELMVRIVIPAVEEDTVVRFSRLAFRERPAANAAYVRRPSGEVRLAVGAVGGRPVRMADAEALLAGDAASPTEVAHAVHDAVEPLEDLDGSSDFKRHLAGVVATRAAFGAAEPAR